MEKKIFYYVPLSTCPLLPEPTLSKKKKKGRAVWGKYFDKSPEMKRETTTHQLF